MPDAGCANSMNNLDDAALARRAAAGSREAFAILVERYGGRLLSFLERRVRCPEDAADAAHDAMLRAWQAIDRYDPRWRFSTWLFTIALRLARDQAKRLRPTAAAFDRAHPASQLNVHGDLERRDESRRLWIVADEVLNEDERIALWLKYGDDHSAREIGRVLDRSEAAVRILLVRARKRLRHALETREQTLRNHELLDARLVKR